MSTVSLIIPSVSTGYYVSEGAQKIDAIAWGLLKGILNLEGFQPSSVTVFSVRGPNDLPMGTVPVVLDETVTRYTDSHGTVDFCGLEKPGFVLSSPGNPDAMIAPEQHIRR